MRLGRSVMAQVCLSLLSISVQQWSSQVWKMKTTWTQPCIFSKPFQRLTLLRSLINQFLIGSSVVQLCCSIVLITDDNGDIQHEGTNYKVLLKSASCTVHILCPPSFLFYFRAQLKNLLLPKTTCQLKETQGQPVRILLIKCIRKGDEYPDRIKAIEA